MIKKSLLLTLLLALLVPWAANAQETVTIGDGTVTSNTNPIGTYYNYSIAEQLYTAAEIGMAGTISSVSFYYMGNAAKDLPITVYMKHVDEADLASAGITLADATEVFSGTLSVTTTAGWVTINLATPFDYNGTSNLLIGFIKDYLYYFSGQSWQGTATTATMARYTQNDYNAYTTSTVPGTAQANRPNIQLVIEPASSDCPKPNNLVASNVTAHTADLTWESEATQFMLQYKKVSDESWNSVYLEDEGTSYQLTNLVAETEYNVRVAAHIESCGSDPQTGDDIYSDWREIEFTTGIACPAPTNLAVTDGSITAREATVTWEGTSDSYVVMIGEENLAVSADFEDQTIPAAFTNTDARPWSVTAGGANGSGYCAIPGNQGVNSSQSDLTLEVTLNNPATVSFNAKVSSEGSYDWGRFFIDGTQMMQISGSQGWTAYSYELAAGTHTLIWRYVKDSSTASNADLFYVDDIVVSAGVDSWTEYNTNAQTYGFTNLTPNRHYQVKVKGNCGDEGYSQATAPVSFTTLESCVTPTGLTASNVTAYEATITWTSAADAWQICVNDDEENLIDVTETTYNFTGLTPETAYTVKVRANCGNEYSDWTNNVSFTTLEACPAPTGFAVAENGLTGHTATLNWQGTSNSYQVAYRTAAYTDGIEEGFGSTSAPEGWTRYNTLLTDEVLNGTTALTTYAGGWNFGTSNGVFDSHARVNIYGTSCKYWLVTPTLTVPAGAAFSFDLALTGYSGSNVPAPATTGTDDRFIVLVSTDNMETWTILREWNNSGSEYVYNNIANTATGENVNFDFSAYAGQTVYVAFYGESTESNADNNLHLDNVTIGTPVPAGEMQYASNITEQTVTLQGLLAETEYEAWLQGNCGSEGTSTEVGPITFTTDVACPAPTGLAATEISGYTAKLNWTGYSESYIVYYRAAIYKAANLAGEWETVSVDEPPCILAGLTPETTYEAKVQGDCGDDGLSLETYITFTTDVACPAPTGLAVNYTGGTTATVTWEGTATSYNIDVNGTVIEGVTSPYTLEGLELATTYTVMVQANCGEDLSDWTNAASFTTDLCMPENQCELTFVLTDSYGDGWNGAYIDVVDVATGESLAHMSNQNLSKGDPETETYTLTVCDGRELQFVWYSGSYDSEASYVVTDINGEEIFSGSGAMSEPVTYTVSCTVNPCRVPTDLAASEISTFKADLSWTGYHDAYNLQYRRPAAADPNATTATVILTAGDVWGDGSGYQMLLDADATAYGTIIPETVSGYGYISTDGTIGGSAGDVSSSVYDEFEYKIPVNADGALATENIVINNSITIAIPAGIYDWCITNPTSGDRMWIASSNGNVGGRYDDFVFEAGMTYEFTVSMHGENDGVEITITPMDEWILVENLTDPSYNLTGLDAKTMYEWQVQGISDDCENGVTEWSAISSFFTEKAYYWNDPQTWTNDSVPAAYADVTIPANTQVIIPSGYTAYADEITIEEGGQIIMEPGAQLYHSNEIPVALQMQNDGYPESKDAVGGFHMIASPVNESVSIASTGLVSGEFVYDLYYFDQAGDEMGNEWINYNQGEGNAPGFTELYIKKGYLYASEDTIKAVFAGSTLPTNAPVSVELDYVEGKRLAGWNLVGNPFTCMAITEEPCYTLNDQGSAIANIEGFSVEVMEGVFVKAEGEGETVTFTADDMWTTGEIGGESYPDKGNLVLNLSHNNALIDRAIVRFDDGRQLPKLQLNPNSTEVFIPMDGVDYAIVNATEMGEMPVSFKAERNDTYTMSFTTENVGFNYLHLIDNMTGTDVNLLANPSYSFKASTTDYATRFKLVFATGNNSEDNFAFFSNGNFVISNEGEATLQVIDVTGRIIKSETINGSASVNVKAATGVYMLRLINGNDVKVQKVVVR